jgi:hypothetical protein
MKSDDNAMLPPGQELVRIKNQMDAQFEAMKRLRGQSPLPRLCPWQFTDTKAVCRPSQVPKSTESQPNEAESEDKRKSPNKTRQEEKGAQRKRTGRLEGHGVFSH